MICEQCRAEGERSTTRIVPTVTHEGWPPDDYWDEAGRFHSHDRNFRGALYACSRGHRWSIKRRSLCWCENNGTPGISEERTELPARAAAQAVPA